MYSSSTPIYPPLLSSTFSQERKNHQAKKRANRKANRRKMRQAAGAIDAFANMQV